MEIEIINRKIKNKILVQQGSSEVNPVIFFVPKTDAGVDLSACKFFVSIEMCIRDRRKAVQHCRA